MEDFGEAINNLRQIRTDVSTIDKWMGQLAAYLDKNIERDKHPELELAVEILEFADTQATRAETLLDAIEYCKTESSRIQQRKKNLRNEIALLKINNKDVEDEIVALGQGVACGEEPEVIATADIETQDNDSNLPTHGLTFISFNDDQDNVKLKRRRSAARIAIENVKKVATSVMRSRSNSRSRAMPQ